MKKDFNCGYHNEESTKIFLEKQNISACKELCPLNPNRVCYRWAICFMAKKN